MIDLPPEDGILLQVGRCLSAWSRVEAGICALYRLGAGGRPYCLETDDRRGLFQTRPDILIKRGDAVVQVIDTKWKRIAARIDDPKQGVSQADVYQMTAYGRLYRCDRLTLLYPHHWQSGCEEGLIGGYAVNSSHSRPEIFSVWRVSKELRSEGIP